MRANIFTSFVTRLMVSFLFMLSIYLLLRGHNYPGGGFVGGLVAASAIIALYLSRASEDSVERHQRVGPYFWGYMMVGGVTLSLLSTLVGLFFGDAFMDATWYSEEIPGVGKLGTPFLFDIGVYFTVMGVTLSITRVLTNVFVEEKNDTEGKQVNL